MEISAWSPRHPHCVPSRMARRRNSCVHLTMKRRSSRSYSTSRMTTRLSCVNMPRWLARCCRTSCSFYRGLAEGRRAACAWRGGWCGLTPRPFHVYSVHGVVGTLGYSNSGVPLCPLAARISIIILSITALNSYTRAARARRWSMHEPSDLAPHDLRTPSAQRRPEQ